MTEINAILQAKMDERYSYSTEETLLAPSELTVTITLYEYRKLVVSNAIKEQAINEAKEARYKAERERDNLKNEVAKLKTELYDLTKNKETEEREEEGENHGTN